MDSHSRMPVRSTHTAKVHLRCLFGKMPPCGRRAIHPGAETPGFPPVAVRYSLGAVAERLGDTSHRGVGFLRSILEGPKRWVAGDARDLRLLATAAGLPDIPLERER
jgi:hypothetical protein